MVRNIVRFKFSEPVEPYEVEDDVCLAIFAAECLHGQPRVRLELSYLVDEAGSRCVLDVRGSAGEDAARIFTGLSTARVGEGSFKVERVFR